MASTPATPQPLPAEYAPSAAQKLDAARADQSVINVSIKETVFAGKKRYQISLTEDGPDSHIADPIPGHGPTILVKNDTVFVFKLDPAIDWSFTGIPMSFENAGHAKLYKHVPHHVKPLEAEIHAHYDAAGDDRKFFKFSFNVNMMQENGTPLMIKIDPEVRNPPPRDLTAAKAGFAVLI